MFELLDGFIFSLSAPLCLASSWRELWPAVGRSFQVENSLGRLMWTRPTLLINRS